MPSALAWTGIFGVAAAAAAGQRSPISIVSANEWARLNASVDGRLIAGRPVAAPCYNNVNGTVRPGDQQSCSHVQQNIRNPVYISDLAGGYQNYNWGTCQATGQGCPLPVNGSASVNAVCYQGSISPMYVDARQVEDVQATLEFVEKHKIRVVVKNTGHDYIGRSSMPDSLQIWTHNIQIPLSKTRGFVPEGCSATAGDTVTIGAGQQFDGVYKWARQNNLTVVGGTAPTVGAAGGFLAGGGFGPLAPTLGLAVDNVQQMKVVLPNGTYATANRCKNQDLFFALRGGGGGTFGIVMESTSKVYPRYPMEYSLFRFGKQTSREVVKKFIDVIVSNGGRWAEEGFGGYAVPSSSPLGETFIILLRPGNNATHVRESTLPLARLVQSLKGNNLTSETGVAQSMYEIYDTPTFGLLATVGGDGELGTGGVAVAGRSVTFRNFEPSKQSELSKTLYELMVAGESDDDVSHNFAAFINIVGPSAYAVPKSDQAGGAGQASIHPHWRNAVWDVLHTRSWAHRTTNASYVQAKFQKTHDSIQPLKRITPGGSGSATVVDLFSTDIVGDTWGQENYERLLAIKKAVDPGNILTCKGCIGYEAADDAFDCLPRRK